MKTKVKLVGLLIGVALITSQSIYAQQTNVVPDSLKYAFKSLKALIIVGDESCDRFVNGAERLAEFLTSLGISVEELYPPYSTKDNVIKASKNVNIFIYKGHGNTMGMICLSDGLMSNDAIAENIKLAPNALVMYNHVCTGAGSSAGDRQSITYATARDRVFLNARPYLSNSAGAYYANNYCLSDLEFFTKFLLEHKNMYDIHFENIIRYRINLEKVCRYDSGIVAGLSSSYSGKKRRITTTINGKSKTETLPPAKSYSVAFVAPSGYSFRDLIKNSHKPQSFLANRKK
ncbi:MAG: hypothetical protein HOH13_01250 [Crocinitomicaceae bacterium]|jgi:hypothetical protein|nr:hypothetical protein [Crocinitomicaceae bacterium]MBT5403794.1 hypothetical protein [Crocinitomicaceae bacterium]MBT6028906.1 hypothetical protein [Crocinitomicaceae bacterium]MBT6514113.1 hypothetical protein [Crocinitomicaceae bacterium]